ncbi:MAG: hypothetical protein KF754_04515 [Planctomycetes bacterium]|nr:hypothetical protein [Planctomycetota bacterium]
MNEASNSPRTPPKPKIYSYPLPHVLAGAAFLPGMAVVFMLPLGNLLQSGLKLHSWAHVLNLLFTLPFALIGVALMVPSLLVLHDLLGRPVFGPLCIRLDQTGLWKGRISRPRLLLRWEDLAGVERRNAGKFMDSWYFIANGKRHRILADRVAQQGGAAFEHTVRQFCGRDLGLVMPPSGPAPEVPYRPAGTMARAEFSRDQRQLGCALVFVGLFTIPWIVTAVISRSILVGGVVALLAGLEIYLWRLRRNWLRVGPPLVVVDDKGLWQGNRDDLKQVLHWNELVVWRQSGTSDERAWSFETPHGKVDITESDVSTPSPDDFVRAVRIASGRELA